MRTLLFGGGGQLGTEIRRRWPGTIDAPSHSEVDIGNAEDVSRVISHSYDLVVNCAAFHNVDACERQPDEAFRFNTVAVDRIGEACSKSGAEFLTISTDYVFSGAASEPYSEGDVPNPIQAYGVSKLAGEYLVLRRDRVYVVRTCGIFGVQTSTTKGHTFIERVLSQLRAGEHTTIASDVIASPTYAGHLAEALWKLVQAKAYGLSHVVNPGPVSWYEFASEAARQAAIEREIEPIPSSQWSAPARRPRYSALANARLSRLGIAMPDWREGIAAYLRDKAKADTSA